jgi:hypothetical protein
MGRVEERYQVNKHNLTLSKIIIDECGINLLYQLLCTTISMKWQSLTLDTKLKIL